jgi:hypothetical protein
MSYFKIDTIEKGEEISRKIYLIMNPGVNTETTHLFGWGVDSNNQAFIDVPLDMECPIYVNENFQQIIDDIGNLLGIDSETEGSQLRQYLETGRVVLGNLIPSMLEEYTPVFNEIPSIV